MKIDILTLFPQMFTGPFTESIVMRAQEKKLLKLKVHNLRDWAQDKHKTVDDRPYGGGTGMILKVDVADRALSKLKTGKSLVVLLTPQGKVFHQKMAEKISKKTHLIFICGHYEGVDERIRKHLVDEEISIGDYVLTGGEIPAMVLTDTVVRLLPGVLSKPEATQNESFSCYQVLKHDNKTDKRGKQEKLLEYPQYTRPEIYRDWKVPEILLSGHHKKIEKWQKEKATEKTRKNRPDLLNP